MKFKKAVSGLLALSFSFAVNAQVVLINPFIVPEGKEADALVFWETARDFLQEQPGYVSTNLHQQLNKSKYTFVNVAVWESEKDFKSATGKMREYFMKEGIRAPDGVKNDPALYKVVRQ